MDKGTLIACIVVGVVIAPFALMALEFAIGILLILLGLLWTVICLPVSIPRAIRERRQEELNRAARSASKKSAEEFYFPYNEDGSPRD